MANQCSNFHGSNSSTTTTLAYICQNDPFNNKTEALCRFAKGTAENDAFYLDIDDGSKLAEVLVELGDVVELTWDLAHLQLGVHIVISLGKTALKLVVKARPKTRRRSQC